MSSNTPFGEKYFQERASRSHFLGDKGFSAIKYPYWDRVIGKRVPTGRLLDIGCAEGILLRWAERRGYDSYGIDISEYAISELARRRLCRTNLLVADVTSLPFGGGYFDAVTCFDVLEHLRQPARGLGEISRCLRTGGTLWMSVPNVSSVGAKLKGENWFAYRDTTHVSLLRLEEWGELLSGAGLESASEYYDTLWDAPYFRHIPSVLQRAACKGLVLLNYWTPVAFPRRLGENLYIVAMKK